MASEIQILKQANDGEKQRRRIAESDKKTIHNQLSEKSKQLQHIQIENKKLCQEKQLLVKQIQFLQKINFDDKTRNTQSYRQKYLQKEN